MKKGLLSLTIVGLLGFSAVTLSACGGETTPTSIVVNAISITNKDDLSKAWGAGDANRLIELQADGKDFNVSQALSNKELSIVSSNADSVGVVGAYIVAKGIGTATVTVTYGGKTDTVAVEVGKRDTAPAFIVGKLADVVADNGNAEQAYVIEATVVSVDETKKSVMIKDADTEVECTVLTSDITKLQYDIENTDDKPTIQSYSIPTDAAMVTGLAADKKVNMVAIKEGNAVKGLALAVDGVGIVHREVTTDQLMNGSCDNAILGTANKAVYYRTTGVITGWKDDKTTDGTKYGNLYIQTAGSTEEPLYVYGATATASALSFSAESGVFTFKNPKDFLTNDVTKNLKIGDTVTLEGFRCDYNGIIELNGVITNVIPA